MPPKPREWTLTGAMYEPVRPVAVGPVIPPAESVHVREVLSGELGEDDARLGLALEGLDLEARVRELEAREGELRRLLDEFDRYASRPGPEYDGSPFQAEVREALGEAP